MLHHGQPRSTLGQWVHIHAGRYLAAGVINFIFLSFFLMVRGKVGVGEENSFSSSDDHIDPPSCVSY